MCILMTSVVFGMHWKGISLFCRKSSSCSAGIEGRVAQGWKENRNPSLIAVQVTRTIIFDGLWWLHAACRVEFDLKLGLHLGFESWKQFVTRLFSGKEVVVFLSLSIVACTMCDISYSSIACTLHKYTTAACSSTAVLGSKPLASGKLNQHLSATLCWFAIT